MRRLGKNDMIGRISGVFCVLILIWTGCAALQTPPPKRRTLSGQAPRMYTRPQFKPKISPEAYHFESPHYILDYSKDISKLPNYDTVEERKSRGSGDLIFLEGQYDFFKELFGFTAKGMILIEVEPVLKFQEDIGEEAIPNSRDALTSIQRGSHVVDGRVQPKYTIKMRFGIDAFESKATRAHELTHAFTSVYSLPAWMDEGIAVLVEEEYGGGRGWAQQKTDLKPIKVDEDGRNILQTWRGDNSELPFRSVELYAYSYRILKELQLRYGMDLLKRFFSILEQDGVYRRVQTLGTSVVVYYLSQAAQRDLVPFFEGLSFKVRKLSRDDILGILAD